MSKSIPYKQHQDETTRLLSSTNDYTSTTTTPIVSMTGFVDEEEQQQDYEHTTTINNNNNGISSLPFTTPLPEVATGPSSLLSLFQQLPTTTTIDDNISTNTLSNQNNNNNNNSNNYGTSRTCDHTDNNNNNNNITTTTLLYPLFQKIWFQRHEYFVRLSTTIIGAMVFVIYHVVFCLAQAATISSAVSSSSTTVSSNTSSTLLITGRITKMAALGVITSGPIFIYQLGSDIPAIYPATDLFLAPFLAQIAEQIHKVIVTTIQEKQVQNNHNPMMNNEQDEQEHHEILFLSTFMLLTSISFGLSGLFCIVASRYKLANLGLFLPYSVLCGFFTTTGFFMYTLSFSVDTGHKFSKEYFRQIFQTGDDEDANLLYHSLLHHIPSICIGIIMHISSRHHPLYVIGCILSTIVGAYVLMFLTGTTLQQATDAGWFYSMNEFIQPSNNVINNNLVNNYYSNSTIPTATATNHTVDHTNLVSMVLFLIQSAGSYFHPYLISMKHYLYHYHVTAPFGIWFALYRGDVVLSALYHSIPQIISLAILYLIRCSLQSAALKKNIPNVTRKLSVPVVPMSPQLPSTTTTRKTKNENNTHSPCSNSYSSRITSMNNQPSVVNQMKQQRKKKKSSDVTLNTILEKGYGYSQLVVAFVGGITVAPSLAASGTLFQLGAEGIAPQYASCLPGLWFFYVTDFRFVQYIPKPAFSCLMVLACLDMTRTWLFGSYYKTRDKYEWCVAPFLVLMAFTFGMLQAIVIGICASTFLFVGNFYQVGTVKFVGTGLSLRSTIERDYDEAYWLDLNADFIQILVLQNYLFFGNIQSVSLYVTTMFADDDEEEENDGPTSECNYNHFMGDDMSPYKLPPKPKYLILDFTLVTGMDTSSSDLLQEIIRLCQKYQCSLYFAGLTPNLRSMLSYAGIQSDPYRGKTKGHSNARFAYVTDLESALAKAENGLLANDYQPTDYQQRRKKYEDESERDSGGGGDSGNIGDDDDNTITTGLLQALYKVDEQHGLDTAMELFDLCQYTIPIELQSGEILERDQDRQDGTSTNRCGLYFVESGTLRVQQNSNNNNNFTNNRTMNRRTFSRSSTFSRGRSSGSGMYNNSTDTNTNSTGASLTRRKQQQQRGFIPEQQQNNNIAPIDYLRSASGISSTGTIGHLHARTSTIGRQAALWKEEKLQQYHQYHQQPNVPSVPLSSSLSSSAAPPIPAMEQTVRLVRIGPGWVIGSIELSAHGMVRYRPGIVYEAITNCRLHHLPFNKMEQLENEQPKLSLHLYKLLSLLATKRQESTIHQLEQLVKIMTNPVPRLSGGKKHLSQLTMQHI